MRRAQREVAQPTRSDAFAMSIYGLRDFGLFRSVLILIVDQLCKETVVIEVAVSEKNSSECKHENIRSTSPSPMISNTKRPLKPPPSDACDLLSAKSDAGVAVRALLKTSNTVPYTAIESVMAYM
ncbi:hypothetical protein EVAR_25491_1 [Eumeta japonica]|uniref:Uncharacterized protein n=1 Tax=Eumeta variegata TaxID=151549 RepID=A0A4C1VMT9_EUMVA|nr:hypothetical protein EVAR_25491_1 [Eumeta japonica]